MRGGGGQQETTTPIPRKFEEQLKKCDEEEKKWKIGWKNGKGRRRANPRDRHTIPLQGEEQLEERRLLRAGRDPARAGPRAQERETHSAVLVL